MPCCTERLMAPMGNTRPRLAHLRSSVTTTTHQQTQKGLSLFVFVGGWWWLFAEFVFTTSVVSFVLLLVCVYCLVCGSPSPTASEWRALSFCLDCLLIVCGPVVPVKGYVFCGEGIGVLPTSQLRSRLRSRRGGGVPISKTRGEGNNPND